MSITKKTEYEFKTSIDKAPIRVTVNCGWVWIEAWRRSKKWWGFATERTLVTYTTEDALKLCECIKSAIDDTPSPKEQRE